jgi:flagellar hook assembly protein FlgD
VQAFNEVFSAENLSGDASATTVGIPEGYPELTGTGAVLSPNPFSDVARIEYWHAERSRVKVSVFNSGGQLVRILKEDVEDAGRHELEWDGSDDRGNHVSNGVYFVQIRAEAHLISKKMLLVRR